MQHATYVMLCYAGWGIKQVVRNRRKKQEMKTWGIWYRDGSKTQDASKTNHHSGRTPSLEQQPERDKNKNSAKSIDERQHTRPDEVSVSHADIEDTKQGTPKVLEMAVYQAVKRPSSIGG